MRIALVIESLMLGGAQRVMSILAGELARRGHAVTLLTFLPPETDLFTISPDVERVDLSSPRWSRRDLLSMLMRNWRRIARLRRALTTRRVQAAISFLDDNNVLTPLACLGTGIPVIISQRVNPRHFAVPIHWSLGRRLAFPLATSIVIQSEDIRGWAEHIMGRASAVRVIPNPVTLPSAAQRSGTARRREALIIAMGRLDRQKGFDLLLEAFARVVRQFPRWKLIVLGDGPQRSELEALAAQLGIADRATLPGTTADPHDVLRHAGLFVLSSRFEGFPNALLEAMAGGLPVISFDCPTGPRDIIRHEVDGLLVPPEDAPALAAAMARLMSDADLRRRLAARAPQVLDRFGVERVVDLWEDVLQEVQQNRPAR